MYKCIYKQRISQVYEHIHSHSHTWTASIFAWLMCLLAKHIRHLEESWHGSDEIYSDAAM